MMQTGKTYTARQAKQLLGAEYFKKFYRPFEYALKPKIAHFHEMSEHDQGIYRQIKLHIQCCNPGKDIKVWATGSRVKGTWKTKEESDRHAEKYGIQPKYSDYDFVTDAPTIGNLQQLCEQLGVKVDNIGGDTRVLVE